MPLVLIQRVRLKLKIINLKSWCGFYHIALELYPISQYAVKPELVFNQDDFTDLLEDSFRKGSVRVTKASKAILKKQNQGVKTPSNSAAAEVNDLLVDDEILNLADEAEDINIEENFPGELMAIQHNANI